MDPPHLIDRDPAEYLVYPRTDPSRPMDPASLHRWLKRCLERAGLPPTIKTHELRHSAADNWWRETGNLLLAQQLLRHESVATASRAFARHGIRIAKRDANTNAR